jgi:hypothetical protein
MEMHVFFRGRPPAKAALARMLRQLRFPLTIPDAKGSLAEQSGYLPMKLQREETGVEFDISDERSAITEYTAFGIDPNYERVANFRWGSDSQECVAAFCSAAAFAKLTDGVVFEEIEGKLLSVPEAIAAAHQMLETLPKPDETRRPGTRPADIRRYLRPLLELRSDLVLRGRHLLIHPIRHLLRGAFFDRSSDKYRFGLSQYVTPLCDTSGMGLGIELGDQVWCRDNEVWQPHFAPLLFNQLAEDIFDYVGRITSFSDLAQELEPIGKFYRFHRARMTALILAGQSHHAAEYMAALERNSDLNPTWRASIQQLPKLLDRDIASVCAEYHAKEEKAVADLKLRDLWEPSPFPAELPEADRSRASEVAFVTSPWVAEPPWLAQELPEHPGEVRFATIMHRRRNQLVLLVALTPEEARRKHDERERYVLATRLAEGQRLVLYHDTLSPQNPDWPRNPDFIPPRSYHLWIYCASAAILTVFDCDFDQADGLEVRSISVRTRENRELWYVSNDFGKGEKSIHDGRMEPSACEVRQIDAFDRALCQFEIPPFGEFEDFLGRMTEYLKKEGFGALPR